MGQNYQNCLDKVKKELSSWRHRFLNVFGKITVIKTLCIPKFMHIATVIPSLSIIQIKEIDKEFEHFLSENNPSVVYRNTRYMGRKDLGLGMLRITHFWKAIKMSWNRRLTYSKSTWAELHRAETRLYTFNPMTSCWSGLDMARSQSNNLVWKEIYGALLSCRRNLVKANPTEFLTLPVNGEPYTTKTNVAMQQDWCDNHMIKDILNRHGEFKRMEDYPQNRRPVHFELSEMESTMKDFINGINIP